MFDICIEMFCFFFVRGRHKGEAKACLCHTIVVLCEVNEIRERARQCQQRSTNLHIAGRVHVLRMIFFSLRACMLCGKVTRTDMEGALPLPFYALVKAGKISEGESLTYLYRHPRRRYPEECCKRPSCPPRCPVF